MRGADVNAETKDSQKRPLFFAAASGSLECAKTCIDSGAEVDHTDAFGICALRAACIEGNTLVMEMLLKRGCKPDIADKQGVTPLHELAYNGHVKATKLLLAYGPRLDLRTQTGLTPVDTTDNSELKSIILAHAENNETQPVTTQTVPTASTKSPFAVDACASDESARAPLWAREEYLCPITCEVMQDPVVAADGHTYERAAIGEWLQHHDLSPLTGATLEHDHLIPNHNLRGQIAADREAAAKVEQSG
mmetsp:Transcript_7892/g.29209  ORF Transcript_7892/g.29209 Transcript_7892/m.29209 type:complete len:249 (+) Transcript_7892:409-1155(+)